MRYFTGRISDWICVLSAFDINYENINFIIINNGSNSCSFLCGQAGMCAMDMDR